MIQRNEMVKSGENSMRVKILSYCNKITLALIRIFEMEKALTRCHWVSGTILKQGVFVKVNKKKSSMITERALLKAQNSSFADSRGNNFVPRMKSMCCPLDEVEAAEGMFLETSKSVREQVCMKETISGSVRREFASDMSRISCCCV